MEENFELVFLNFLNKIYSEILFISLIKEFVDVLIYKFVFYNIKVVVKEKIL